MLREQVAGAFTNACQPGVYSRQDEAAVATFTMVATIDSGAEAITKRERGTLVFVQHEGSWKIVHEHFSAAE